MGVGLLKTVGKRQQDLWGLRRPATSPNPTPALQGPQSGPPHCRTCSSGLNLGPCCPRPPLALFTIRSLDHSRLPLQGRDRGCSAAFQHLRQVQSRLAINAGGGGRKEHTPVPHPTCRLTARPTPKEGEQSAEKTLGAGAERVPQDAGQVLGHSGGRGVRGRWRGRVSQASSGTRVIRRRILGWEGTSRTAGWVLVSAGSTALSRAPPGGGCLRVFI